ncbi:MAG: TRAP transporter substrate-binding protein DctP [Rubrivivax sp.]|jgi:TRAP-type C4-dicarboxylate transport system substrate-binding protein|nr:TRAP transporter substrate-binding protein DctP [Rubrivivax sp.]MBK8527074.1 TRAP transporter substrate-binding protein DctP [Rubrivivax sp.]
MNIKSILAVLAALVMAAGTSQAADVTWRLGSSVGPKDTTTLQLEDLAKRVGQKSGGRFKIDVIPIETIGFKNVDSLRVLKQGVVEAMNIIPYYVVRDEPLMGVFAPHGVLLDAEQNLKIVDEQYKIGAEILASNKWGIVQVARAPFGALRDLIIMSKEPVNTLDGLRKIKLRHFTKDGLQAFNALGVSTQNVPSSELYLALKTGVVDASIYSPVYGQSQSIYEVTCCMSYLAAFSMAYPFSIGVNKDVWAKVPPDLQKLFVDEANAMWQESLETWKHGAAEKKAYDFLATKGMKLLAPMPVADQKLIQAELLKIWRQQSEKISPAALGYFERINKALNSGK